MKNKQQKETDVAIGLKQRIEAIANYSNEGRKYSKEEMLAIQKLESEAASNLACENRRIAMTNKAVGRSGIHPLHQRCTVSNFEANTPDKVIAKKFAYEYITGFESNNGQGFIFSGTPGTGKNHLSAAICNALIKSGKSCLVITINEMMQKLRNTYHKDSAITEDQFIQSMINYDLLVLDEVGLQRGTDAERLAINQIVDQRVCRIKPTGMLTNLSSQDLEHTLGERVMDRMKMNDGEWIAFNWESYRR